MIGNITNTNKIVIQKNENIVCDLPLKYLTDNIPEYDRKYKIKINGNKISSKSIAIKKSVKHVLFKILGNLNFHQKNGFMNNMMVLLWEILFLLQIQVMPQ